jgi:hypothetical protein
MRAFILSNDSLLFLSKMQKKILEEYNSIFADEFPAIPIFPLWAFCDWNENFFDGIFSCRINFPRCIDGEFFFPVEVKFFLDGKNFARELKIIFGRTKQKNAFEIPPMTDENSRSIFPRTERIFRTGEIESADNEIFLFGEKWKKIF